MTETFPLASLRAKRMKRRLPIQHAVIAAILVMAGVDHIQRGSHSIIPYLEIVSGAALIALVIAERLRHHLFGGTVAWVEFAGGVMMAVEAMSKLEERHHLSFYLLSFLAPAIVMGFAIFDAQIGAMRRLTADDDGLAMQLRLFIRRRVRWANVESWSRSTHAIDVVTNDGKRVRFRFKDVENPSEAMNWTEERLARYASAAKQLPGRERDADQSEQHEVLVSRERRSE